MSESKNTNMIKFKVLDTRAVIPKHESEYAEGVDLTAIDVYKTYGKKTTLYRTGLAIEPPKGYYTEIIPRSSLSKTGYMLSNSVGIIDYDYRGELFIALTKVDESMPDLVPPFKKAQLIMKKREEFGIDIVKELNDTKRGDGGFGSTD
tara:strand:- start:145 stop:588 length:444 start_codon:yes stop_codon:yes gene_type:complete